MVKNEMKSKRTILVMILVTSFIVFLPQAHAEPTVSVIMEKITYSYCEKLFYTIEVSEITGENAIIHIRDETGKGSSAIPIAITSLQNPIPSLVAFEKEVFPLGKYFIDVQYSGSTYTAEFNLVDLDKVCIPGLIKPIMVNWLSGNISDGFLLDAFEKYVDKEIIDVSFEINEDNVYLVNIPNWVRNVGQWWIQQTISDEEFAHVVNYLIDKKIISISQETGNEI